MKYFNKAGTFFGRKILPLLHVIASAIVIVELISG